MENTFDATKIQAWVHNLDPFLIQFTETFGIRWYGLAYLTGFVCGAVLMIFLAKRGRRTLPAEQVTDFITYIVLGTMIGGRLGYAIFYSPDLLTDFKSTFPYWGVLEVWQGGMASHGGIAGVTIASFLYARKYKLNWLHLGDLTTLGGAIGIFCGRIANFINGELPGRVVSGDIPWAVKFPIEMHLWVSNSGSPRILEPERLSALGSIVQAVGVSPEAWSQWVSQYLSNSTARRQISATMDQIILAIQGGNQALADQLAPLLSARHPSTLYAALFEGLFIFIVCFLAWRKPRKPGVIGALFLSCYAAVRICTEQFRMPDAHIGYQIFGLTRGQILSIAMLAGALLFLAWVIRRPAEVIAGWGPEARELKRLEESQNSSSASKPKSEQTKAPKKKKK